jgi:tetratricopeptide (TPR) repeat protein
VIATARDEREAQGVDRQSEWEKLEFKKYRKLWERFGQYALPEPKDGVIVDLLTEIVPKTQIQADVRDFPRIAQRNDRTFANIVENLITLQGRKLPLSSESFPETLDRTWRMRYRAAIRRHSRAIHLYDAVALLRLLNVELNPFVVLPVAEMLAAEMLGRRWLGQMPWVKVELRRALQFLTRTERILEPRDGQIEAREHPIEMARFIPKMQKILLKLSQGKPLEMQKGLMDFAFTIADLGRSQEAQVCFERVLAVQPASERAWFGQGNVLFDQQQWDQAIASYDKALNLKAGDDQIWFNRGLALSQMQHWDEALDSYVQALLIKPDKVEALDSQGITLKALGRYSEALASYDKAVAINPDYGLGWYNRGLALAAMGDLMGMVESCQRALQVDRTNASAWYNSACAYALMGKEEKAIGSLKAAIDLNPDKYKVLARDEPDFERLQPNPEFRMLLATCQLST